MIILLYNFFQKLYKLLPMCTYSFFKTHNVRVVTNKKQIVGQFTGKFDILASKHYDCPWHHIFNLYFQFMKPERCIFHSFELIILISAVGSLCFVYLNLYIL